MRIDLLPTNDRHHLATLLEVAECLRVRGHECRILSLAEWRGLGTPVSKIRSRGFEVKRVVPPFRAYANWAKKTSSPMVHRLQLRSQDVASRQTLPAAQNTRSERRQQLKRRLERVVARRVIHLVRRRETDLVVLMNDAAPPGDSIARKLREHKVAFALLQEGIRFPLPTEAETSGVYGGHGADLLCAWGDASAEFFRQVAKPATRVIPTGTPRFPTWDPPDFGRGGRKSVEHLGLFTNPIDDQGFVSTEVKMEGFERLLNAIVALSREGHQLRATLRHHGGESRALYERSIRSVGAERVCEVSDAPLASVLQAVDAGIVFASSVGLEVLMAGRPLAVLETPGHGFVHDFVSSGAAVGIPADRVRDGLLDLIASAGESAAREDYIRRHLTFGDPATRIADAIEDIAKKAQANA